MNHRRTILALLAGVWLTAPAGADVSPAEPVELDLKAEWSQEFRTLELDLTNRARFDKIASQAFHPAALLDPADRGALGRPAGHSGHRRAPIMRRVAG
jgi:hypothetical protein